MIANDPNILGTTDFFNCFYNGFSENSTIWFAYRDDDDSYENHFKLQLSTWKNDKHATNSMKEIISLFAAPKLKIQPPTSTAFHNIPITKLSCRAFS